MKSIENCETSANVLSRTESELKMMKQIIIIVFILLILGIPYIIYILISFITLSFPL
jgi:hypothetical protein